MKWKCCVLHDIFVFECPSHRHRICAQTDTPAGPPPMKVARTHTTRPLLTTTRHSLTLDAQRQPQATTASGTRASIPRSTFVKLETTFLNVRGPLALATLDACRRDVRVIAIGGDQLTGKTTLCHDVLVHLDELHYDVATALGKRPNNVTFLSAGKVFRQLAAERNVPVGTFSKLAKSDPSIDVSIEYETCKAIMGGILYTGVNASTMITPHSPFKHLIDSYQLHRLFPEDSLNNPPQEENDGSESESGNEFSLDEVVEPLGASTNSGSKPTTNPSQRRQRGFTPPMDTEHTIIIEGRNPAVMAAYCRTAFNKSNVFSIYLACNPRVQSRRYIGREIGRELAFELDKHLPSREYKDLTDIGAEISLLLADPEQLPDELKKLIPDVQQVVDAFVANQARDDDDKQRYRATYSFPPELSYTSPTLYDCVVDTSYHLPKDTLPSTLMSQPENNETQTPAAVPPIDDDLLEFDPLAAGTISIDATPPQAPIPASKSTAVDSLLKEFETQEQQREIDYEKRIKTEEEKLGVHL